MLPELRESRAFPGMNNHTLSAPAALAVLIYAADRGALALAAVAILLLGVALNELYRGSH